MELYRITITAHVDDLETMAMHMDADVQLPDERFRSVVISILPAHLRKVAADVEAGDI